MEDIYKYPHKVSNCKYYVVDICIEKSTNIEILIKCYPQYPQKKLLINVNKYKSKAYSLLFIYKN